MYRRTDETHRPHRPGAPRRARGRIAGLPTQMRVAFLAALASLALATLLAAPTVRPAQAAPASAQALSCNGPCVGITNPLYTSQGQLVAEGPVGAHLTVEGSNWPPGTTLTIWPAPDAATCLTQLTQPPADAGTLTVHGDGTVNGPYSWPQDADTVNQAYILCAVDGTVTVSPTVQSDGIDSYTVLSASAPSVSVSPTTVTQGQDTTLTITGQNWLPQQALNITVCSDNTNCATTSVASQSTASAQDGSLQVSLTIKGSTAAGTYYVMAQTTNGALQAPPDGSSVQVTVSTPTPTPTPTPSPTPTPTPRVTPPSTNKGNTPLLIVLLGTLSLLFLIGGIISIAIYTRGSP